MKELQRKLKKDFGDSRIKMASETPTRDVISTGSVALDFATGIGGIPRGCLAEIYGAESLGKTTLSYYMIAGEQAKGNACAFINLEGQFDPTWAKKVAGVNPDKLLLVEPLHGDQAAEMLAMIVNHEENTGERISLVVFDSIGAMLSAKEAAEDGTDRVGGQSKLITGMVKRTLVPAWQNKVTVVFLNQIRDVMNATYGNVVESPGGHALKHAAVMRIHLKPAKEKYTASINGEPKEIGQRIAALIKKNKAGAPKAKAEWDFIFDERCGRPVGIDREKEVIDLSIQFDIIEQRGAYYLHPTLPLDSKEQHRVHSKDAVVDFLTKNPEALGKLREELMELARRNGGLDDGSS